MPKPLAEGLSPEDPIMKEKGPGKTEKAGPIEKAFFKQLEQTEKEAKQAQ